MSLLSSYDGALRKVMWWRCLMNLGIDVFLLVNWVCKIHRKQTTEKNSKKLIIILQYKEMLKKQTISNIASKYIKILISQELPLLRIMMSTIIDWNNLKNLAKFPQENFKKSHEILDQFAKSIKSYIKMLEPAGLIGPPPPIPGEFKEIQRSYSAKNWLLCLAYSTVHRHTYN